MYFLKIFLEKNLDGIWFLKKKSENISGFISGSQNISQKKSEKKIWKKSGKNSEMASRNP